MSDRLQVYQILERCMKDLDALGSSVADSVRDLMDPIWYAMTEEEIQTLDDRPEQT